MHTNFATPPIALNCHSSTFGPLMPRQTVATLFVIENSHAMSAMWPDLQGRYLHSIMTMFENANPMAPVTTFIVESLPVHNTGFVAPPRQYDTLRSGLQDIRFNRDVQNRLSVDKILHGIEFLASVKFSAQPIVRHIIIVAASTPFDDMHNPMPYRGESPWLQLAHILTRTAIQCHMVLCPTQDMSPFMMLFDETVRLQNLVEELPSFAVDNRLLIFRLSATSNLYSATANVGRKGFIVPPVDPSPCQPVPPRCKRVPPRSPSQELENHTNIVSRLQQFHRLTEKPVNGVEPMRDSFFKEEIVQVEPMGAHTLSSLSALSDCPRRNGSRRALSISKTARSDRMASSSPMKSRPHRPGLPRQNSFISSPETIQYRTYWPPPVLTVAAQRHEEQAVSQNLAHDMYTEHLPFSYAFGARAQAFSNAEETCPHRLPRGTSCPGDEEPFNFNAEYVAATAALFNLEILPAYPDLQPGLKDNISPRHAFYIAQGHGFVSPSPSSVYDPGELYGAIERNETI
ncbi:hypothetical protein FPV67DRAFT_1459172 [Lyophyllum atratum]|nr:hypothetical protein FPV67DRAFT_1459172 [Lyophyllum atratum]